MPAVAVAGGAPCLVVAVAGGVPCLVVAVAGATAWSTLPSLFFLSVCQGQSMQGLLPRPVRRVLSLFCLVRVPGSIYAGAPATASASSAVPSVVECGSSVDMPVSLAVMG